LDLRGLAHLDPMCCPACGEVLGPGTPGLVPRGVPAAASRGSRGVRTALALLALVVVTALAWRGRGERPGGDAPTETDTLAALLEHVAAYPPADEDDWDALWARVRRLPEDDQADARLKPLYGAWVSTPPGRDDARARRILGHREFVLRDEDRNAFMDLRPSALPFMVELERARTQRWFTSQDDAAWDAAHDALAELRLHAERVVHDAAFRVGLVAHERMASDPVFGPLDFVSQWSSPWLVCVSDGLPAEAPRGGAEQGASRLQRAERAARRSDLERRAEEKVLLLQQVEAEWMRRFAAPLGLQPLMAPYGGRPDYPIGVRSYADGCPIVVGVFTDAEVYRRALGAFPYASDPTSWGRGPHETEKSLTFDAGPSGPERAGELSRTLQMGADALLYWFARQVNNWRPPPHGHDALRVGLSAWFAAAKVDEQLQVEFVGINVDLCGGAQRLARHLEDEGRAYPVLPLKTLTAHVGAAKAREMMAREMRMAPEWGDLLFAQQAWALVHFLMTHDAERPGQVLCDLLGRALRRSRAEPSLQPAFQEVLGIASDEDWSALDARFVAFVQDLLRIDLEPYTYEPPPRRR
jgi:hypothetical protein